MKLIQYNQCFISIVGNDGLLLLQQDISSDSAEYTPVFEG